MLNLAKNIKSDRYSDIDTYILYSSSSIIVKWFDVWPQPPTVEFARVARGITHGHA